MRVVRKIAGVGVIAAIAALSGCAQGPNDYDTAIAEITARHREAEARRARQAEHERAIAHADAKQRQSEDRVIGGMREALGKFQAETPPRCSSRHLVEATSMPPSLPAQKAEPASVVHVAFMQRLGIAMLEVGDAARKAGCAAVARQVYETAIRILAGPDYPDLRLRAQVAIREIRSGPYQTVEDSSGTGTQSIASGP